MDQNGKYDKTVPVIYPQSFGWLQVVLISTNCGVGKMVMRREGDS